MRLPERKRGQAAIMLSMSLVVTLGALGLVVDIGWAYWRKEAAKTAADSGAMGAVMAMMGAANLNCGSGVACTADATTYSSCAAAPANPPTNNLGNGCLYAKKNGFVNSGKQTVKYLAYTSGSPVTGVAPAYWVRFQVGETIPATFSAILGHRNTGVAAESTAAVFTSGNGACVFALNNTAPGTITLAGGANVQATCGMWDDSNSASSLTCSNNTTLNAGSAKITLSGGNACNGTVSPAPLTNQPRTTDPFASVPAPPDKGRCDYNGINAGDSITVPADGVVEVCGDMSFKSNSATTLPAALYYMKGTSNLSWQNGSVTGTGVTIAMNGGSITINGNMGVTLTAPTTGTYRGIVIYQKRGLASPPNQKLNGGSTQDFMGSLYLPGSQVTYTGGSATSITALIGDTIVFSGNSSFGTDQNGAVTGIGLPNVAYIE